MQEIIKEEQKAHQHQRFFPFIPMAMRELPSAALEHRGAQDSEAARGHSPSPVQLPHTSRAGSGIYLQAGAQALPSRPPEPGKRGRPVPSNCCYVQHGGTATALPAPGTPWRGSRRAPPAPAGTPASPVVLRHPPAGAPGSPGHGQGPLLAAAEAARSPLRPRRRRWGQGGEQR